MPITEKGETIMGAMKEQYGSEEGERVFFASKNKGTIAGVDSTGDGPAGAGAIGPNGVTEGIATEPPPKLPADYPTGPCLVYGGPGGPSRDEDPGPAVQVALTQAEINQRNEKYWAQWKRGIPV